MRAVKHNTEPRAVRAVRRRFWAGVMKAMEYRITLGVVGAAARRFPPGVVGAVAHRFWPGAIEAAACRVWPGAAGAVGCCMEHAEPEKFWDSQSKAVEDPADVDCFPRQLTNNCQRAAVNRFSAPPSSGAFSVVRQVVCAFFWGWSLEA